MRLLKSNENVQIPFVTGVSYIAQQPDYQILETWRDTGSWRSFVSFSRLTEDAASQLLLTNSVEAREERRWLGR